MGHQICQPPHMRFTCGQHPSWGRYSMSGGSITQTIRAVYPFVNWTMEKHYFWYVHYRTKWYMWPIFKKFNSFDLSLLEGKSHYTTMTCPLHHDIIGYQTPQTYSHPLLNIYIYIYIYIYIHIYIYVCVCVMSLVAYMHIWNYLLSHSTIIEPTPPALCDLTLDRPGDPSLAPWMLGFMMKQLICTNPPV